MALSRRDLIPLGLAGGFALAMPIALLWPGGGGGLGPGPHRDRPVTSRPVAEIGPVYERQMFAPAEAGEAAPVDAPALVGVAGRLDRDAVAMVQIADGGSRSLSVGESVDGWRLESLAIDAAFFVRGRERVRVALPGGEEAAPTDQ